MVPVGHWHYKLLLLYRKATNNGNKKVQSLFNFDAVRFRYEKKLIELLSAVYAFYDCNTKTFKTCSGNELVMVRAARNSFADNTFM